MEKRALPTIIVKGPKKWALAVAAFAALKPKSTAANLRYRAEGLKEKPAIAKPHLDAITPREKEFRHLSFTFAIIALSAHVAQAGGKLTPEKYAAFRDAFPLRGRLCLKIRQLFSLACSDATPPQHYITQIKSMFPKKTALFCALIERLFTIASQGGISPEEERAIAKIARGLDVSAADYTRIRERHINPPKAHEVLGVAKRARANAIKQRYRQLMQRYHPDRYADDAVSPEVALLLRLKTAEINEAYKHLSKRAA